MRLGSITLVYGGTELLTRHHLLSRVDLRQVWAYLKAMNYVSKTVRVVLVAALLAGCGAGFNTGLYSAAKPDQAKNAAQPTPRPDSVLGKPPKKPSPVARTVEQFDTTTNLQRAEAANVAAAASGTRKLGKTVSSLGDPAQPGFWLKTPLVNAPVKGRVHYPGSGKSVAVDLIPIKGAKTAGSRISLAALRLLGAPLTGLPELTVYRN